MTCDYCGEHFEWGTCDDDDFCSWECCGRFGNEIIGPILTAFLEDGPQELGRA